MLLIGTPWYIMTVNHSSAEGKLGSALELNAAIASTGLSMSPPAWNAEQAGVQRDRAATCEGHPDTVLSEGWCRRSHQALTSQAPREMCREYACLFLFYLE